jgi:hypothetical protein
VVSGKNAPEDAPQLCLRERTRVGGRTAADGKQAASALLWLTRTNLGALPADG